MGESNAGVVEAIAAAIRRHDLDELLSHLDPEIEHCDEVNGTALRGHEGMRRHFAELWRESPDAAFDADEVVEGDDWVVVRQRWRGLPEGELVTWVARRFVEGRVREIKVHSTRAAALDAAGLAN